jgi:hypothetical protein
MTPLTKDPGNPTHVEFGECDAPELREMLSAALARAETAERERDAALATAEQAATASGLMAALERAERAESSLIAFRAARVSWSPEMLAAIERGDVAFCAADAKTRHDNWQALHARAEVAERGASALRLELEEARRERIKALVELNATKAVLDTCERQVAELNVELAEATQRADDMKAKLAWRVDAHDRDGRALMEVTAGRDAAEARCAQLREAVADAIEELRDDENYVSDNGAEAEFLANLRTELSATDSRWFDAKLAEARAGVEAERDDGLRKLIAAFIPAAEQERPYALRDLVAHVIEHHKWHHEAQDVAYLKGVETKLAAATARATKLALFITKGEHACPACGSAPFDQHQAPEDGGCTYVGSDTQSDVDRLVAEHDARVYARAIGEAAAHFRGDGSGMARNAIAVELERMAAEAEKGSGR